MYEWKSVMLIEKTREMCVSKGGSEMVVSAASEELENRIREEIKDYGN